MRTREVAFVSVALADDSQDRPYSRPDVLQILEANSELKRLDQLGALGAEEAPHVRVLLAVVGRLSAGDMAEAFPPASPERVLRVVTLDEMDGPR